MAQRPRVTAGVLLSRMTEGGERELALVHRPRYDDWTWPKGGVEPGEQFAVAAAREAHEETGHAVRLGHRLGQSSYTHGRGATRVHWWAATLLDPSAPAGVPDPHEIDQVVWVSAAEAASRLTYPADQNPLSALMKRGPAPTTVLLVRHASAGDRRSWPGPDGERPLDGRGQARAERLAGVLGAFAPSRLVAATPVRCGQTLQPLADLLGKPIARDRTWDDRTWQHSPRPATRVVTELAKVPGTTAVCSQGETIPGLLAWLARDRATKAARSAVHRASRGSGPGSVARSKKGSFWVLSFEGGELVAADYIPD